MKKYKVHASVVPHGSQTGRDVEYDVMADDQDQAMELARHDLLKKHPHCEFICYCVEEITHDE